MADRVPLSTVQPGVDVIAADLVTRRLFRATVLGPSDGFIELRDPTGRCSRHNPTEPVRPIIENTEKP